MTARQEFVKCPKCDGRGEVNVSMPDDPYDDPEIWTRCIGPHGCNGTGLRPAPEFPTTPPNPA